MFRRNGLQTLDRLRNEMDRLFDDCFQPVSVFGQFAAPWERAFPNLNVWEDEQNLFAEAEVPGMSMEDMELTVAGNELTIKGKRSRDEREGVTLHRRERGVGAFTRTLRLPFDIDADKVAATLEHGVLTITLPKPEAAKPRRIEVKAQAN